MDIHSRGEWERLGTELRKRRGQLGYGSRERKRFAADTGLHYRLVQRVETGERDGYPPETIAQVESAYRLERDAIGAFFTTGRLQTATSEPAPGPQDAPVGDWEIAVMARAEIPYPVRLAAVRDHRELVEQERRRLRELGIDPDDIPVPSLARRAVRAYLSGPGDADAAGAAFPRGLNSTTLPPGSPARSSSRPAGMR